MPRRYILWTLMLFLALSLVATGCKKPPTTAPPESETTTEETAAPAEPEVEEPPAQEVTEAFPSEPVATTEVREEPTIAELNESKVLATVFFAFDSSELSDTTRATLQANADWMLANPGYNVVIEGHCDERGTIEYNLALGERRARSVREYMVSLSVPESSMRIVSFGKERPVDSGSNEAAWARNRRGEFVIESR
jgi:peptidoglycan-associated lipoprotein